MSDIAARVLRSSDAGAPALSGQAGSLVALLRALLVNGYGTGPNAKAGFGWTQAFLGTNEVVFRNSPVSGSGHFLRVMDASDASAGVASYEAMAAIDEGTNRSPPITDRPNGAIWTKSSAAGSTARAWWAVGNDRYFYLFIDIAGRAGDNAGSLEYCVPCFAGDLDSFQPGDQTAFLVSQGPSSTDPGYGTRARIGLRYSADLNNSPHAGLAEAVGFISRNYAQTLVPALAVCASSSCGGSNYWGGSGGLPYPHPVDNGLLHERGLILEGPGIIRGAMPGVSVPLHTRPFSDLATVPMIEGVPAGRKIVAKSYSPNGESIAGQLLFEVAA